MAYVVASLRMPIRWKDSGKNPVKNFHRFFELNSYSRTNTLYSRSIRLLAISVTCSNPFGRRCSSTSWNPIWMVHRPIGNFAAWFISAPKKLTIPAPSASSSMFAATVTNGQTIPWHPRRASRSICGLLLVGQHAPGPTSGGPGGRILITQRPDSIHHGRWVDEKIIRFVMQPLTGTWQIHHAINHHVGHMNSFRPQLPGKGLRQGFRVIPAAWQGPTGQSIVTIIPPAASASS